MTTCVIGVDAGTSGVKAVAVADDGRALGRGHRRLALDVPAAGRAEQDVAAIAAAAAEAVRAAVQGARTAGVEPAAVALSAALHGVVAIDGRGATLTPAWTWADTRAAAEAAELRRMPGAADVVERTGTPLHPMSWLAKLRWAAGAAPDLRARAARWVAPKDVLVERWTGVWATDASTASATGLWNGDERRWDDEALALAQVDPQRLPDVVAPTWTVPLSAAGAAELDLRAGTPVVVGAGDGPVAHLGLDAPPGGAAAAALGTSGALRVALGERRGDPTGRRFCYLLDGTTWVTGGATSSAGLVLGWLRDALLPDVRDEAIAAGRHPDEAILTLAEAAGAAAPTGLVVVGALAGERAPLWQPDLRGRVTGLSLEHTRVDIARAALEGAVVALAAVAATLPEALPAEVRLAGGLARHRLLRRLLADALDRPVVIVDAVEPGCTGAAALGARAIGLVDDAFAAARAWVRPVDRTEPHPEGVAVLRAALPRWLALASS